MSERFDILIRKAKVFYGNSLLLFPIIIIVSLTLTCLLSVVSSRLSVSIGLIFFLGYLFNVTDILSTYSVLDNDSNEEMNPVARFLFEKLGVIIGGFAIKTLGLFILVFASFNLNNYSYFLANAFLSIGIVATSSNIFLGFITDK